MAENEWPISHAQRKRIMASCKQIGLDDDARRDLMESVTGKRSTTRLTWREASAVIDELKRKGAKYTSPRANTGVRPYNRRRGGTEGGEVIYLITARQKMKIAELIEALGWDEKRLVGFIARQTQSRVTGAIEKLDALTLQEGQKVIEGLKALLRRNTTPPGEHGGSPPRPAEKGKGDVA